MASDWMPSATRSAAVVTTSSGSGGVRTTPLAPVRSVTSRRQLRGTSSTGGSHWKLYSSPRVVRRIWSTSRNPRVVMSPVGTPRRWIAALVVTVVPCPKRSTSASGMAIASTPVRTARDRSAGVERNFATRIPSGPSATKSVNVPPVSTPTRIIALPSGPRARTASRHRRRFHRPPSRPRMPDARAAG